MHYHYNTNMTTNIQIRIDSKLKKDSEKLLEKLGLDIPTAFRMFLKRMNKIQGIPFPIIDATDNIYYTYTEKEIEEILEISNTTDFSPTFKNSKEAIAYLKSK